MHLEAGIHVAAGVESSVQRPRKHSTLRRVRAVIGDRSAHVLPRAAWRESELELDPELTSSRNTIEDPRVKE
jgi:hypothetical protein